MQSIWLEDFLALAHARNFTRAAAARNVTQSAFSRRIRALEHWFGAELIDREAESFMLTPAGRTFLAKADELMKSISAMRTEARGDRRDRVVMAMSHSASICFLPALKLTLQALGVDVLIKMLIVDEEELGHQLRDGTCALALTYRHPLVDRGQMIQSLPSREIARDDLIIVAAPGYLGTGLREITVPDVLSYLGRVAQLIDLSLFEIKAQAGTQSEIRERALRGEGFGLILRAIVAPDIAAGTLVAANPELGQPVHVDLVRGAAVRPPALRIWSALRD